MDIPGDDFKMKVPAFFTHKATLPILYSILLFEIVTAYFVELRIQTMILIVGGLISVGIHLGYNYQKPEDERWVKLRELLKWILVSQKILPSTDDNLQDLDPKLEKEFIELSLVPFIDAEYVKEVREVGVDGLLIIIYLMYRSPEFCNVRTLETDLYIPRVTIYRNLNRLVDMQLIVAKKSVSQPNVSFYKNTETAENIVLDLYELIQKNHL